MDDKTAEKASGYQANTGRSRMEEKGMTEGIQLGEQLIAGFIDGIQLTDPVFAIRIRTLVEKINELQLELMVAEE